MATIAEVLDRALQHHQAGQLGPAEQLCRQVLEADPEEPNALAMLGVVAHQTGRGQEAAQLLRRAVAILPQAYNYHVYLGAVYVALGDWEQAAASYGEAVRWQPWSAPERNRLGQALRELRRLQEAEAEFREAIRLVPAYAEAYSNLGMVLADQGRFPEAIACYRQALQFQPNLVEALHNLGLALMELKRHDEALAYYEQAARLRPDDAVILNSLATLHKEQGYITQAISEYRRALHFNPGLEVAQSNLLFTLPYAADFDPQSCFADHVSWARRFDPPPPPPAVEDRDPDRRLRIGYVSPDFREHVMGRYSESVIGAHDRSQVEVFCYSSSTPVDARTARIQAAADHWRPILGLSDAQAAEQIRRDRIDLLVDLAGHTFGNRLGVFAKKPAPIQVTHLGYPFSTGLSTIDYLLTDEYCDPPDAGERLHTEKLVRLPRAQWCYTPQADLEIGALPARAAGHVTFGEFNSLCKVTEEAIGHWSRILKQLPGSRIHIKAGMGRSGDERVLTAFARHGIEPARVQLLGWQKLEDYLGLFGAVDICLDTFPYSGNYTTADALWMAVPVVSLAGKTRVGRQGIATLVHAGLADLVTQTPEAYIETAVALARDLPRLEDLRANLRRRLLSSPLCDVHGFTRDLEAAYRNIWKRFLAQEA